MLLRLLKWTLEPPPIPILTYFGLWIDMELLIFAGVGGGAEAGVSYCTIMVM